MNNNMNNNNVMNNGGKEAFVSAFNDFVSNGFEEAAKESTRLSWGGGQLKVELYDDGEWRTMPEVGNGYVNPHSVILSVPALHDDDWEEGEDVVIIDGALEAFEYDFHEQFDYV